MFYVQHLKGIGHIVRASLISRALHDHGLDVTIVMGGDPVDGFPAPGPKCISLPPLRAGEISFNDLTGAGGKLADEAYLSNRRELLLQAFQEIKPDILITEAFPFGRRQMHFELLPLLDAAKNLEKPPLIACSVRDILEVKKKIKRAEETVRILNDSYDLVMVHGDPVFARLDETFPLADQIRPKIRYTGLVVGNVSPLSGPAYDVVISSGGGATGENLMNVARKTYGISGLEHLKWCFVTGANLPSKSCAALERECCSDIKIERYRSDFRALLANARLSVSRAGYNTTCDLLQAGCPSVLVPYAAGEETEQTRRAEKLGTLGFATVVNEKTITPKKLADAMNRAINMKPAICLSDLMTDGVSRSVSILIDALREKNTKT